MQDRQRRRYALYNLRIDEEFSMLQIQATAGYVKRLEQNIIRSGAIKPIMVWRGFVVDGHKRYVIFHRHCIPFFIYDLDLDTRYDVMEWICDKSLKRLDLSEEYRKYYIGKKFMVRYEKYVTQKKDAGEVAKDLKGTKTRIEEELGKDFKISYGTVRKYTQYARAMDIIRKCEPEIAGIMFSGRVKVSHENVVSISHFSPDQIRILKDLFKDGKHEKIQSSHIWNQLRWSCLHPSVPSKKKEPEQPKAEIKNMPKYDPDAELQSLILTIPTWKCSIERVRTVADFGNASRQAKVNLLARLSSLSDTVQQLSAYIKEKDNEHGSGTGNVSGTGA